MECKDEEELSYLESIVPSGFERRITAIDSKSHSKFRRVLCLSRSISILMLEFRTPKHKQTNAIMAQLMKSAAITPEEPLDIFSPLEVQSLSYLVEFLSKHTAQLAAVVAQRKTNHTFDYVSSCLLPAIFCYYSTSSSCGLALSFYTDSIDFYTVEQFTTFVIPFFSCASVAPFSDHVFRQVFWGNYLSKTPISVLTSRLLTSVVSSLKFLHHSQIALLRLLSFKWEQSDLWYLIINSLVIPQIQIQYCLSPFAYSNPPPVDLNQLISHLSKQVEKRQIRIKIDREDLEVGLLDIPDGFVPYNGTFNYQYVLTLKDIKTIMKLPLPFPSHFQLLRRMSLNAPKSQKMRPFYVRYFTKSPKPSNFIFRPLFFKQSQSKRIEASTSIVQLWYSLSMLTQTTSSDTLKLLKADTVKTGDPKMDLVINNANVTKLQVYGVESSLESVRKRADLFESYLYLREEYKQLNKWYHIVKSYSRTVSFIRSVHMARQCPNNITPRNLYKVWTTQELERPLCAVDFWFALHLLAFCEKPYFDEFLPSLAMLEARFGELLQRLKLAGATFPTTTSKAAKKRMWEASGLVSLTGPTSSFLARYIVLENFLLEVNRVVADSDYNALVSYSIVVHEASWIFRTHLYLILACLGNPKFTKLCSNSTEKLWKRFTSVFLQIISKDPALTEHFAKLIENKKMYV